jgi:hypothetical protein
MSLIDSNLPNLLKTFDAVFRFNLSASVSAQLFL